MERLHYLLLFLLTYTQTYSQKYDNHWTLNNMQEPKGIILSFDTFPPRLHQHTHKLSIALTSLSDSSGRSPLLSASPSRAEGLGSYAPQVIDTLTNFVITNGPGVSYLANTISLILPRPGAVDEYYVLNSDAKDAILTQYSTNQLTMARLRFDTDGITVLEKNTSVWQSGDGFRLQAVKHANGRDYWVLVPGFNGGAVSDGMYFHSFLLDSAGLHYQTKQNILGSFGALTYQIIGSPDGKYLIMSSRTSLDTQVNTVIGELVMFEVDRCTGQLELVYQHTTEDFRTGIEGAAFSPDSKLLYYTNFYHIMQQDLTVLPQVEIDTVFKLVFDPNSPPSYTFRSHGQMRLGPDGRIYIRQHRTLGLIEKPNTKGVGCAYRAKAIQANCHSFCWVPNSPEYRLGPMDGSSCDTLGLDNCVLGNYHWYSADSSLTVEFIDHSAYEPESWQWSFGDGSPVVSDTNPVHTFPSAGIYEVCMVVSNSCRSDTVCQKVEVFGLSGVEELSSPLGYMRLSPNPTSDLVTIHYQVSAAPEYVEVYNLRGQRVYQMAVNTPPSGVLNMDTSAYPPGIYAVCLHTRQGSVVEKLVVAR